MNLLYGLNYAIFAVFFTLFTLEIGVAVTFLTAYKENRDRLKRYLMPIWEITGTFAIFYVVNFIATYPSAISIIGSVYIAPLLVAAVFFIFRNAFIAYSEYIGKAATEKSYIKVYSVATLITAFLVVMVLGSAISGVGVNLANSSLNLGALLLDPFGILMFVSVVLFAVFAAKVFFKVDKFGNLGYACAPLGIFLVLVALHLYASYAVLNAMELWPLLVVMVGLLVATIHLSAKGAGEARFAVLVWLFDAITYFGVLLYPYWFGGAANSQGFLVNAATGYYALVITLLGGLFLIVALAYFVYITYMKKAIKSKGAY